ncbi:hypothetical protein CCH79_00020999, partial [Gambusia affinis]
MQQTEVIVNKLRSWCRGEGINESHALLTKVPQNTEVAQIEETLQTIKCLGRVRVRGRMLDESTDQILVLCECREKLRNADIPRESLRAEIREVKSMFAALSSQSLQDTADKHDKCSTDRERLKEPSLDAEVVALKKQVKQLQQKVKSTVSHHVETPPAVMAVYTPSRRPDADERFCYRCGESGHMA